MSLQMLTEPMISVIVPIYNVEKYLPRCLDSILKQSYSHLEIILVDDGSTDNSGKICDSYAAQDPRVHVIHQPNGGVSSARNRGIEAATGQYIGFVDPDDYIAPQMYEILLRCIRQHQADMVVCQYTEKKLNGKMSVSPFPCDQDLLYPSIGKWMYDFVDTVGYQTVHNKLFTREIIGDTRFTLGLARSEDVNFVAEITNKKPRIFICHQPLYYYVLRRDSAMKLRHICLFASSYEVWKRIQSQWKNNETEAMKENFRSFFIRQTCLLAILIVVLDDANKYAALLQELQQRFATNIPLCAKIKRWPVRYWVLCFAKFPTTTRWLTRLPLIKQGLKFYIQHK